MIKKIAIGIAIGSDHAGFKLKQVLKNYLMHQGWDVLDLGCDSEKSVDYPDYGFMVADKVANGEVKFGLVICGSGIGISIAANRNNKARAALCYSAEIAKLSRQHNDANILALGSRFTSDEDAKKYLDVFLSTEFEGGRHSDRVNKLYNC